MKVELTLFQGRVGDRNDLAMPGARAVAEALGTALGLEPVVVGTPEPALSVGWQHELERARPALRALQARYECLHVRGCRAVSATSRCAASIATLPVVARHRPDACIVWFDAHGDLNTPASTTTGYLGGLVLSAALGLWDSGFGAGLAPERLILVGQRELDPFEVEFMRRREIHHIRPGAAIGDALRRAIGSRPAYVHLDCDVLDPGLVPTEYACAGGLSLADLRDAAEAIAGTEVVGLEIAEFQHAWTADGPPVSPAPLVGALEPLLGRLSL